MMLNYNNRPHCLPRTFLAAKSRWTIPRPSRYSMPCIYKEATV